MGRDPADDLHPTPPARRRINPPSIEPNNELSPTTSRLRYARDVARETTEYPAKTCKAYSEECLRQQKYREAPEKNWMRPGPRWIPNSSVVSPPKAAAPGAAAAAGDASSRPTTTTSPSRRVVKEVSPRLLRPQRADQATPPPLVVPKKVERLDLKFERLYSEATRREDMMAVRRQREADSDTQLVKARKFDGTTNDFVEHFLLAPLTERKHEQETLHGKFAPLPTPRKLSANQVRESTSRLYTQGMSNTKEAMARAVSQHCGKTLPPRSFITDEVLKTSVKRLYENK